jgi:acyl-CoA synthetase (AMP-forming)/AMP-acid ligase II
MNWLIEKLSNFEKRECLVINDESYDYRTLVDEIKQWMELLNLSQIPSGTVVSVEGKNSLSLLSLIFALYLNNNIIVPINVDSNIKRNQYQKIAGVEFAINVDNDEGFYCTKLVHKRPDLYNQLTKKFSAGLVLFSSGTTGKPKAIVLDFSKLLFKLHDVNKPSRTLSFLTYDHIGGINTIIHTFCSGGCVIFPETRKVDTVLKCIEKSKVEVLPTTPTFINMLLLSDSFSKYNLSSLRLITYGTEAMSSIVLKKISQKLPNVNFKQTYGLSEVGILSTKSKNNSELWLKIGGKGFDYKIVGGVLWIKSDYAMLGYLNAEAPFDEDGYFNTQDMVEVDGDYIRILGRKSEIINIGGEKVYPVEIEGVLTQIPGVLDAVIWGVKNPIMGMGIKALIKYSPELAEQDIKQRVNDYVKQNLENFKRPLIYNFTKDDLHSPRFKKMRSFS